MPSETLTKSDLLAIARLRHKGCAVIVWLPSELGNVAPRKVEDRSIELGYEVIDTLSQYETDEEEDEEDEDE